MVPLIHHINHDSFRELQLHRPPINAFDTRLSQALLEALQDAEDAGVQGLILSGGSGLFSGGMDVPYLLSLGDDKQALLHCWETFFEVARHLARFPVPIAAAIGGHAPAAGCLLALCCDYRVMAQAPDVDHPFRIGLNEVQVGLAIPRGVQHLLRRTIGHRPADRLLIQGAMVTAHQALHLGLVDELSEISTVSQQALQWLVRLARLPREPMLKTRATMRADVIDALQPENLQLEDAILVGWSRPDTQKALKALVARLGK